MCTVSSRIISAAYNFDRKVAIAGRSMVNVVGVAQELGYLDIPDGTLVELDEINNYPKEQIVLLTTGSQGEPMSALTRMAMSDHRRVQIEPGDTVIISANPIPGNEKLVARVVDMLSKLGAEVIHGRDANVHVSGHACREELMMLLNLVKPQYFMPVHGEYRMLLKHAQLAEQVGMPKENIFVAENGNVLELNKDFGRLNGKVASGRVLIDGGRGDIGQYRFARP